MPSAIKNALGKTMTKSPTVVIVELPAPVTSEPERVLGATLVLWQGGGTA